MNKFLHPPMQALKQAAREGNAARSEGDSGDVCAEGGASCGGGEPATAAEVSETEKVGS